MKEFKADLPIVELSQHSDRAALANVKSRIRSLNEQVAANQSGMETHIACIQQFEDSTSTDK